MRTGPCGSTITPACVGGKQIFADQLRATPEEEPGRTTIIGSAHDSCKGSPRLFVEKPPAGAQVVESCAVPRQTHVRRRLHASAETVPQKVKSSRTIAVISSRSPAWKFTRSPDRPSSTALPQVRVRAQVRSGSRCGLASASRRTQRPGDNRKPARPRPITLVDGFRTNLWIPKNSSGFSGRSCRLCLVRRTPARYVRSPFLRIAWGRRVVRCLDCEWFGSFRFTFHSLRELLS